MTKKLELRRERIWYDEPPKPEVGAYKFRIELVTGTAKRVNHWPGYGRENSFYEYEEDEPEETPEYSGKLDSRESISLEEVNKIVAKYGLNEKDVHFTASFADDYLSIEVVHIKAQSNEEQAEAYQDELNSWNKTKSLQKEEELKRIKHQIESLEKQAQSLKKKI